MKIEEVIPGLARLSSESPPLPGWQTPFFYLIGNQNLVLIDAGYREDHTVEKISRVIAHSSRKLKTLVLTHGHIDHSGAIPDLKENFQPKVMAHKLERPVLARRNLEAMVDEWIEGEPRLESELGELLVIATPGHSPGHISLYLEKEAILFTGDLIVGEGTSFVGPPDGDMSEYLASLKKVRELEVRLMLPGHGPVIRDPARHLKDLIAHRELREYQILKILGDGPETSGELAGKIYAGLIHPGLYRAAEITVLGHLSKLEREGKVAAISSGNEKQYRLLK